MFRRYADVLEYLNRFTNYERERSRYGPREYNLRRMRALTLALGEPQNRFRSIHVAGTKGKGSVCIMLEAALRGQGYRTGLYTSPHVVDMLERIQIDGRPVSRPGFVRAVNALAPHLERLGATYFEIMTAAAFWLFAQARVDYGVIEVGLGGRLDCTNVIRPVACVINTVDLDHTDKLGTTIPEIAREKAGILKPGVPCVVGPQRPAALEVIREEAARQKAPVRVFGDGFGVLGCRFDGSKLRFALDCGGGEFRGEMPFAGMHQTKNAAVAVEALKTILPRVDRTALRRSFAECRLPARVQIVHRRPRIIVDGAHNPISIDALVESLNALRPRRTVLVFGCAADKDFRVMLQRLLPHVQTAIFTRARAARAVEPIELLRCVPSSWSGQTMLVGNVGQALREASALVSPGDTILITGSFYVAGEALIAFHRRA